MAEALLKTLSIPINQNADKKQDYVLVLRRNIYLILIHNKFSHVV